VIKVDQFEHYASLEHNECKSAHESHGDECSIDFTETITTESKSEKESYSGGSYSSGDSPYFKMDNTI
jgi:hypothetical protein